MRFFEFKTTKPLSPHKHRIRNLKQAVERKRKALAAERERQRRAKERERQQRAADKISR